MSDPPDDGHRAAGGDGLTGPAAPGTAPRARARRASAALITELPPDVDEALVKNGYKGKLGLTTLNTLVHRIAVLSKAHQMARAGARTRSAPDVSRAARSARTWRCRPVAAAAHAGAKPGSMTGSKHRPSEPLRRPARARAARTHAPRLRPARCPAQAPARAHQGPRLQLLLATCDESLKDKRDRALLLFAWVTGGRRRSEVASATLENLQRVDADAFIYTLTDSKTNQRGDLRPEDHGQDRASERGDRGRVFQGGECAGWQAGAEAG